MFCYSVAIYFTLAVTSSGAILQKTLSNVKIIGGTEAAIEDNPWQVSLEAFGIHQCGGSIIGPDTIITAAHCIDGLVSLLYEVVSGTNDLLLQNATRSKVKETIVHENYVYYGFDIAIIKLTEPLIFNNATQAVPLADEEPAAGDTVRVTGWGILKENDTTTPNLLYTVDVAIVGMEECIADYSEFNFVKFDETMICAGTDEGGKDACQGDSGGPLTRDGVLVGIVSFGYGCGKKGYPEVYTSVASLRQWIKENAGI